MLVRGTHAVEVALIENKAAVDDEEPVRVGLLEHGRDVERASPVFELDAAEVALPTRQVEYRTVSAGNRCRASELADTAKPQPVVGRIQPVRAGYAERPGFILQGIELHVTFLLPRARLREARARAYTSPPRV